MKCQRHTTCATASAPLAVLPNMIKSEKSERLHEMVRRGAGLTLVV